MNRTMLVGLIFVLAGSLFSCASWWSSEQSELSSQKAVGTAETTETNDNSQQQVSAVNDSAVSSESPIRPEESKTDLMELSQARMVERINMLESELRRQREKIRLLEQGLLTGIAPEDLKQPEVKKLEEKKQEVTSIEAAKHEDLSRSDEGVEASPLPAVTLDPEVLPAPLAVAQVSEKKLNDPSKFETLLAKAKSKYQSSDFSAALADFAAISRDFGENYGDGVVRYWLGKCYMGLKEHGTARSELEAYIRISPSGSYIADARLDLAKSLWRLGLKERARNELKRIIKDFDGQEVAEIASHELNKWQVNL